jgi:hypothetical protein
MPHKRFITTLYTVVFDIKETSYTISVAWIMAPKVDYISSVWGMGSGGGSGRDRMN